MSIQDNQDWEVANLDRMILLGYEFLTSFIPFLVALILFRNLHKKKGLFISNIQYGIIIIFAFYIIAVFYFTGTGTLYDILLYKLEIRQEKINLIPFSNSIDSIAYLQNILLFIPFGILVPYIWKKRDSLVSISCAGFTFSSLIEISQLLNNRSTDIDDLMLNTLGAIIGVILHKIFSKVVKSDFKFQYISNAELPIYIAVMFVGRFLFFNEMGMAKLLYRF